MKNRFFAHIAILGANIIYGINYTVAKEIIPEWMHPLALVLCRVIGATMLVALCLYALGVELAVILLLASIASATAPAVLLDVVKEMRVKGKFADIMLGIVALDDAWALLIFSFMLAAVGAVSGQGGFTETITSGFVEISGSLLLGLALGLPMAYLSGRIRPGEPTLAEALGLVALCAGIAVWLDLSPILAAMMMGSTVASFGQP